MAWTTTPASALKNRKLPGLTGTTGWAPLGHQGKTLVTIRALALPVVIRGAALAGRLRRVR
jgi:hypothetical protein